MRGRRGRGQGLGFRMGVSVYIASTVHDYQQYNFVCA